MKMAVTALEEMVKSLSDEVEEWRVNGKEASDSLKVAQSDLDV